VPRLAGVSHTLRKLGVLPEIERITFMKPLPAVRRLASMPRSKLAMEGENASVWWITTPGICGGWPCR